MAYNNRGIAYGHLGQYERSIQDLDRAIQLDSDFAMAYYNRGVAYGFLGRDSEAYADERKACSLNSEYC